MYFDICNTTQQTVVKYHTFHMCYYSVNITIRGSKEAIHQNVDIFGTRSHAHLMAPFLVCPMSILMYSVLNSRRPGAHIQPWSLTQPYMVWGVSSRKVWNFSAAKAMDQHLQHGTYCCKSKGRTRVLHGTPLTSYLLFLNLLDFLYG